MSIPINDDERRYEKLLLEANALEMELAKAKNDISNLQDKERQDMEKFIAEKEILLKQIEEQREAEDKKEIVLKEEPEVKEEPKIKIEPGTKSEVEIKLKVETEKTREPEKEIEPEVVEKVVTKNKKTLESVVTFRVAKSTIDASQLPNVERIASYLNKYRNAKVSIKGYASPEGNLEKNKQLATARAEAVKNLLVKRYKISADRIQAEGNGIGDMFSEPDWNRVSIANIVE